MTMKEQNYLDSGIDLDEVLRDFPVLEEYEESLRYFLGDEFFLQLPEWVETEDYGMAIDAVKGLYILAGELKVFPLYIALLEVYEDLLYQEYKDIKQHTTHVLHLHQELIKIWKK